MLLKASQRAGAKALAAHLLNLVENDHVEVYELKGFLSDDLTGALSEIYAISKGTSRCKQFLFSVSLSPPENESVPIAAFEKAILEIEKRNGLVGQSRATVFHEKNGRRHAHCVWSRINTRTMKAVNLPYFKLKLRELSRELFLEHDWKMPPGLVNSEERNPLNYSRAEWQQAKRIGRDPKMIKQIFIDCWAVSDGLRAFANAMEARGYYLAKGDRRGHVAVDWRGEVYAISRWVGVKARDVKSKLGDPSVLPSVAEVKSRLASTIEFKLRDFSNEIRSEFESSRLALQEKRKSLVMMQREERVLLKDAQQIRWAQESVARAARFRRGLKGLWDRITGRHAALASENATEVDIANERDAAEMQTMIERQLEERRTMQRQVRNVEKRFQTELSSIEDTEGRRKEASQHRVSSAKANCQAQRKQNTPTLLP